MTAGPTRVNPYIATALIALLFAGALGIRVAIAGGDWGCAFADDPALCAAVKEVGK